MCRASCGPSPSSPPSCSPSASNATGRRWIDGSDSFTPDLVSTSQRARRRIRARATGLAPAAQGSSREVNGDGPGAGPVSHRDQLEYRAAGRAGGETVAHGAGAVAGDDEAIQRGVAVAEVKAGAARVRKIEARGREDIGTDDRGGDVGEVVDGVERGEVVGGSAEIRGKDGGDAFRGDAVDAAG